MHSTTDQEVSGWHKSSYSGNQADCVETGIFPAGAPADVAVRDTKNRAGGMLGFSATGWSAFIADIKAGDPRLTGGLV